MARESGYAFTGLAQPPSGELLLEYVRKKDVTKATSAVVHGTNANFQDPKTGNAALHIAVLVRSEILVRLLIVFDANLTLKNHDQKTALDLAENEGATVIAKDIKEILDLQKGLDADQPRPSRLRKGENLLLSLDGGGIRGLVFVQVVLEMEKRREKLYPDSGPLLLQFNWITGTSTGGIAALKLAASKVSAKEAREMYFELKDEVLSGEPPIPDEKVDKVFKKVYGESKTMSEIKEPNVAVMTTLADQSPPILHIMSNYGGARNKQLPPEKQLVWKAARATSAVPIFFHPQDGKYLDGGLIADNPTTDAVIDILEHMKKNGDAKLKMVLSLGCGLTKPEPIDDVDFEPSHIGELIAHILSFFGKHKLGEEANELLLVLKNFKAYENLQKIEIGQIIQPNGEVLKRGEFLCTAIGTRYFRINPVIEPVGFLSTDDTNLINMLFQVVYYMLENCRNITDPVLDCIYQLD